MRKCYAYLLTFLLCLLASFSNAQQTQTARRTSYGMGYLEYLPAGYSSSSSQQYPCIIFLHGSGERGDGSPAALEKVKAHGPPMHLKRGHDMCFTVNGKKECFIVLSPQISNWTFRNQVIPFVQYALQTYKIDPDRVYLTGLSMGGEGTWFGAAHDDNVPNHFAAIAPMAGRASVEEGCSVASKKIPVWGFHGDADYAISLSRGRDPINGMIGCNANPAPLFTIYPGAGHGQAWEKAYRTDHSVENPNVYEWFLTKRRNGSGTANKPPKANAGTDITVALPTNTATLNGSGTDQDGTIKSYSWSRISGPNNPGNNGLGKASVNLTNLVQGTYVYRLTVTDNKNATSSDDVTITVNAATNRPPTANAGSDIVITLPTNTVTLNGSGSDPDGSVRSYAWSRVSGPNNPGNNGLNKATVTLTNCIVGVYVFRLSVTDDKGTTTTDDVRITVNAASNKPPVANAGSDKVITLPTNSVALHGSGSDADGTVNGYSWSQVSGPNTATSTSRNQSSITVSNCAVGEYVFRLTVTDNHGATASDDVKIIVNAATESNQLPVANAGPDKEVTLPSRTFSIHGTGSDSDGSVKSVRWSQVSGPNTAQTTDLNQARITVTNCVEGRYIFRFTVTDNQNGTSSDDVVLTVKPRNSPPPSGKPPVANAGSDKQITLPSRTFSLNGVASDADGSVKSVRWSQVSGPNTAQTTDVNTSFITVTNCIEGEYIFRFTVTDNSNLQASDDVKITVRKKDATPPQGTPPVANAGSDKSITLPSRTFPLNGVSSDADGTVKSVRWSQVSGPNTAKISDASQSFITVTNCVEGTYVFRFTVTDNTNLTAYDDVSVIVKPKGSNDTPAGLPPVAKAGQDKSITLPSRTFPLNGAASDPDGSVKSVKWSMVSGPNNPSITDVNQSFITVRNCVEGTYVFRFTVTDNQNLSAYDDVTVVVRPANSGGGNTPGDKPAGTPPAVYAGPDKYITLPSRTFPLNGGYSDADGKVTKVQWSLVSGPNDPRISDTNQSFITVTNCVEGRYIFRFTVTDNSGLTASDDVTVDVRPQGVNVPGPLAYAGPDKAITLPSRTFSLTGGASSEAVIRHVEWSFVSGPNTPATSALDQPTISVTNCIEGKYVFRFTVTDSHNKTHSDDVLISVLSPAPSQRFADSGSTARMSDNNLYQTSLGQNYPNPFSVSTEIPFSLAMEEHVVIKVYDGHGHEVMTLVDENMTAGEYSVPLTLETSGIYYYKLFTKTGVQTKRLVRD